MHGSALVWIGRASDVPVVAAVVGVEANNRAHGAELSPAHKHRGGLFQEGHAVVGAAVGVHEGLQHRNTGGIGEKARREWPLPLTPLPVSITHSTANPFVFHHNHC